jgi:hypothetical protein
MDRLNGHIGLRNKSLFGGKLPSINTKKCPEIDKRMSKYLIRLANQTANHVIQDTLDISDIQWERIINLHGVQIYRGFDVMLPPLENCMAAYGDEPVYLHGVTEVNASLEEFAMLFKMDSHKDTREHSMLFNPDLLKKKNLYTLVPPSGEHPRRSVNVKWCVIQSPFTFMFHHRDFCYLECQKEFHDPKGRKGWIRSMHSIKMPCCPNFEKTHGVVRANLYRCAILAIESDRLGVLEVHQTIEMDLKVNIPQAIQIKMFSNRLAAISTIDHVLQTQRLSSFPLLGDLDIPSSKIKASCHFCYRSFSTFYRCILCRKCGKGVCTNCSNTWSLDIPCIGRKKVRICTVCSAEARYAHVIETSQQQRNTQQHSQSPEHASTRAIPALSEPSESSPAITMAMASRPQRCHTSRQHQEIEANKLVLAPPFDSLVSQQQRAIQNVHLGCMRHIGKSIKLTQDDLLQCFDSPKRLNLPAVMRGTRFTSTRNEILQRRRQSLLRKNEDNNPLLSQQSKHSPKQTSRYSYSVPVRHKSCRRRHPSATTLTEKKHDVSTRFNDPTRSARCRLYDEEFSSREEKQQEQELQIGNSMRKRSISEMPEMVYLSGEQKNQPPVPPPLIKNQSPQEDFEYEPVENYDGKW